MMTYNASADCVPRGLFIAALLNEKFPVHDAARVIDNSPCPAFGFVNKSFGEKWENLNSLIGYLSRNTTTPPRPITAVVYVDCGPCRPPRRPKGLFKIIAPNETINSFNHKLVHRKLSALIEKEAIDLFNKLPISASLQYIITPSLEDNLTDTSYLKFMSIIKKVFKDRNDVSFSRNPLVPGLIDNYDKYEIHTYDHNAIVESLIPGDIANGDGEVFCYSDEKGPGCQYDLSDIVEWLRTAKKKKVITLIFRPEFQGIPLFTKIQPVSPDKRTYKISHIKELIKLLRTR